MSRGREGGFTLIELSIVLVIIGLIVGSVLAGQSLIAAAAVRAQISQIEKYNTGVNTFRDKYGGLPGDLQLNLATQFGFNITSCDGLQGQRDGNGLIEGYASPNTLVQGTGETALFWQDLNSSHLISDSSFNISPSVTSGGCSFISSPATTTPGSTYIGNFFPSAKLGTQNFLYVYSLNGVNWFGMATIIGFDVLGNLYANATLSVTSAYAIDKKIDDGLPTTGSVTAVYLNESVSQVTAAANAAADSATTCYHTATTAAAYSLAYNNGNGANCALSFRMQAGD